MTECPACAAPLSNPPLEEFFPPYRLLRCDVCDLVFTDPMPFVGSTWYVGHVMYVVRDQFMGGSLLWNHRQFLRDLPACGGRLLDVGCGTGQFLVAAQRAGYQVTGVDFNPEAVRVAHERFGLEDVFAVDLETFCEQRKSERFAVVTAFEVLEHSPVPAAFLRALGTLVSPGGFLAISVPNRERWPAFRYDWDRPPHHLTRWSRAALTGLVERNGFKVLRVATGWRQGESLLHQHLRFGFIAHLLNRKTGQHGGRLAVRLGSPVRMASVAFRLKQAAVKALAVPVDLTLGLVGATGMDTYVLGKRGDGG